MLTAMSDELPGSSSVPPMSAESFEPAGPPAAPKRWAVPLAAALAGFVLGGGVVGTAWAFSGGGKSPGATPAATTSPTATTFTLTGTLELNQISYTSGPCSGTGGYSDISDGTSVTVYDGAGQVVAVGALGAGTRSSLKCDFPVLVTGVPTGSKFYQVEISHRGKITLSSDDAQAGRFAASLG